jgi:hypothetical protein
VFFYLVFFTQHLLRVKVLYIMESIDFRSALATKLIRPTAHCDMILMHAKCIPVSEMLCV